MVLLWGYVEEPQDFNFPESGEWENNGELFLFGYRDRVCLAQRG